MSSCSCWYPLGARDNYGFVSSLAQVWLGAHELMKLKVVLEAHELRINYMAHTPPATQGVITMASPLLSHEQMSP